ncbi:MAG: glycosyltransferase [Patescibacteria group bacterium]
MKILFAALKHDYGDPQRGPSFEFTNFFDTLQHMSQVEAELWPIDELILKYGKERMNQMLLDKVKQEEPDLLFTFLFTDEFDKNVIADISQHTNTLTLNWFGDDQWRFAGYSELWAPAFSWIASTDSEAVKKYQRLGLKNVIKTQWACNHFSYHPVASKKKYGVTFVGQPHSNRRQVIKKLREVGISIDCFGYGWPSGRIFQDQMVELFSSSAINLNLSNVSFGWSIKSVAKIFLHRHGQKIRLNNFSQMRQNATNLFTAKHEQMKGRNFEVPGCGGFLLTSYIPELSEYYELDKEVVVFKNHEELIQKIKYYLHHNDERQAVARAGYERTIKDHTYERRFRAIFKTMGLL